MAVSINGTTTVSRPPGMPPPGGRAPRFFQGRGGREILVPLSLSAVICGTLIACVHRPWAPLPWLAGIVLWGWYFRSMRVEPSAPHPGSGPGHEAFPFARLVLVLGAAAAVRLAGLDRYPLGPYVDEILTLHHSLDLLHRPFDLFGQMPLAREGWVETTHLYLYFDLLVLKLFGSGYWGMKLFSVLPGIAAAGAVFLTGRLLFGERVGLWTGLLFAFAHWPVRLSRYGWDASFMVMVFSLAVWLLLLALQRGRPIHAHLSGVAAGLCLYSYLASRICLVSLLGFLVLESAIRRGRWILTHGAAFVAGTAATAFPLFLDYLSKPGAFWVRTAELNVFHDDHPLLAIAENAWRHLLMFHLLGGKYARDNFPGLPMMDVVTGLLLVAGAAFIGRVVDPASVRLIVCLFIGNFAGGIFSTSQEGPPYVYRTAAVMIPAFLLAGAGLAWLARRGGSPRVVRGVAWAVVLVAVGANLYLYFGLEPRNFGAMRVMAYEPWLIGKEISRDDLPVVLAGSDLLGSVEAGPGPGERYAAANPAIVLPLPIRMMAVLHLSGRYDPARPLAENLARPRGIVLADPRPSGADPGSPGDDGMPAHGPAKIIFRGRDQGLGETIRSRYPGAILREIRDARGEPLFAVATLPPG